MTEYYKHKCLCGCGGKIEIKPYHKYKGIPRFIHGHHFKGKKHTEETKKKQSDAKKGKNNSMFGKNHTEEAKKKISDNHVGMSGKKDSDETRKKKSDSHKGKKHTEETKKNMSDARLGPKNHQYIDGRSKEPYLPEFNNNLKESIRERDKRKCQKCYKTEEEIGQKLDVHHIDYDKENNDPEWLISLCRKCNIEVNKDRTYWTYHFEVVQRLRLPEDKR